MGRITAQFRYCFPDMEEDWHDVHRAVTESSPVSYVGYHVPQTVGDQVWEIFEFESVADKVRFLREIPEEAVQYVTEILDQDGLAQWCNPPASGGG